MSWNTIHLTIASAVLAAMSVAIPAQAATFLDGAYGSKEGCTYAKTANRPAPTTFCC